MTAERDGVCRAFGGDPSNPDDASAADAMIADATGHADRLATNDRDRLYHARLDNLVREETMRRAGLTVHAVPGVNPN